MLAALRPSRFDRESVREPTGSPVEINVSTTAVRISRSRSPMFPPGISAFYLEPILTTFRCRKIQERLTPVPE
jgi:hypothetical protein